jgi:hypothetical protein
MTDSISADAGVQEKVFAFLMDPTTHPGVCASTLTQRQSSSKAPAR